METPCGREGTISSKNGAKNIYKISYNHINNIERPLYLSRSKKSGTLHDVP